MGRIDRRTVVAMAAAIPLHRFIEIFKENLPPAKSALRIKHHAFQRVPVMLAHSMGNLGELN